MRIIARFFPEDYFVQTGPVKIDQASREQLANWRDALRAQYADYQQRKLSLDLTRGKP